MENDMTDVIRCDKCGSPTSYESGDDIQLCWDCSVIQSCPSCAKLKEENERLKKDVWDLSERITSMSSIIKERDRLKKAMIWLDFKTDTVVELDHAGITINDVWYKDKTLLEAIEKAMEG